ncbi:SacI domain-containing protein [Viridothelium virens]|uniref:SacI domain-containing protein n=1 Tax=Viridothelium virens TaxID=1048519 RepID=A0A6A6H041_VIRVR|nr:SacI domain-containing protein [Viridothelium virens]
MPGLVRKLLIYAAADGLILQPLSQRNSAAAAASSIRIDYKSHVISPVIHDWRQEQSGQVPLEAHGIIGLLSISSRAYLISICRRRQVAQIQGKAIYVIQDVALIPLASQSEANTAISQARGKLNHYIEEGNEDATAENESLLDDVSSLGGPDEASLGSPVTPPSELEGKDSGEKGHKKTTSVVEDVIGKRGAYGRFAERWFSRAGWSADKRRTLGMSSQEDVSKTVATEASVRPAEDSEEATKVPPLDAVAVKDRGIRSTTEVGHPLDDMSMALLPKVLHTTRLLLGSKSFFYSHEHDLSHSLSQQPSPGSTTPLFKQFDPLFFWNHHLTLPFIDAGQVNFVLPLMQGFIGQKTFTLQKDVSTGQDAIVGASQEASGQVAAEAEAEAEEAKEDRKTEHANLRTQRQKLPTDEDQNDQRQSFMLTLISRRSTERAGLRYLRRGIDDRGHTANAVETEQILSSPTWDSGDRIYSFLQCRGSIPLYFSQSPYSFKPIPVLYGSPQANQAAFKLHFATLLSRYRNVQIASLVDKHGTESHIGQEYQRLAESLSEDRGLDEKQVGFKWFDFHNICRGMKFENVSLLIQELETTLSSYGWTVLQEDKPIKEQDGILRTNCMDCLDRTNVVQSATGRWALERQLADQGFKIDLQSDPTTSWFNQVWADNGDAISRQYAGTAALKGDYTRTRKRKITGALTDFSLTLNRYYNNIFGDYFTQACIDYLLGRTNEAVFDDFEADMKSKDLAMNMSKVRQSAIETCAKIVIEDSAEDLESGWTLISPHEPNTLRRLPFEECVVLVTNLSLYLCRFDWSIEKVSEFTKVDLDRVTGLQKGIYITSTLTSKQRDEEKNYGFVVSYYAPSGKDLRRVNTRSLESEKEPNERTEVESAAENKLQVNSPEEQRPENHESDKKQGPTQDEQIRILAFKALPPRSSAMTSESAADTKHQSEKDIIENVCDDIQRVVLRINQAEIDGKKGEDGTIHIEEKPIISLADAKKSTTYLESIGHSIKRLVWA